MSKHTKPVDSEIEQENNELNDSPMNHCEGESQNAAQNPFDATQEYVNKIQDLESKLKASTEEISSLKDQYLRKAADLDNYRKRMIREKDETLKYANTNILVDLISIIDDFERAIQSTEQTQDFKTLHDGVSIIEKQLVSMLESKYNLKRFEAKGSEFDPNAHEAVQMVEQDDIASPIVLEDFMRGYSLHERIVRTAKVKVAMPKNKNEQVPIDTNTEEKSQS